MRNNRSRRNGRSYSYTPGVNTVEEAQAARSERRQTQRNKKSLFRRFYLLYIVLLAVLAVVVTFKVSNVVLEMSDNDLNNLIAHNLIKLTDDQIVQLFTPNQEYETAAQSGKNIRSIFESGDYTVKKSEKADFYNVYHDGKRMLSAKVETVRTENHFGLLHYNVYQFAGVSPVQDVELYHYELNAPESYKVTVNGTEAVPTGTSDTDVSGFLDGAEYVVLPQTYHYSFDHLTAVPEVEIYDTDADNRPVSFDLSEEMNFVEDLPVYDSLEAAGCDFDAIAFSEMWSRFLTADLTGGSRSFNTLKPFFIEGSSMYQKARAWATGVDITFVSHHTLDNPPFTDQKVSNVVKYTDDAVSADIYLEKHMTLSTRAQRTDVFNSTLYLVRHEGSWRVVNIRGITE